MIRINSLLYQGQPFYVKDERSENRYQVIKLTLENYKVNDIAGM